MEKNKKDLKNYVMVVGGSRGELDDVLVVVESGLNIKEYLEIGVKNDEHLIKMMAVIQRISNNAASNGGDSLLTDEELKQLQAIAEEVAKDESKKES